MNYQNSKTRKNTALQGWSNSLLSYEKDIFQIEKLFFWRKYNGLSPTPFLTSCK